MTRPALSLQRFQTLLEAFEVARGPLSASEIGESLGAPRSSTAALLRALTELGLLSVARGRGGYMPSVRLGAMCSWILEEWMPTPETFSKIASAHAETGETGVIWAASGLTMEVVHVLPASAPIALNLNRGARYSMGRNAITLAHLMALRGAQSGALIERIASQGGVKERARRRQALEADLARAREAGFAEAYGAFDPEAGAIAAPLKGSANVRGLVLAFGGPLERVKQKRAQLVRALRGALGGGGAPRRPRTRPAGG
jgi:DNA-binding IclR family transcriptional regulator